MPTPMDAMLGLVVAAIGLLTLVISFSIAETRKRVAGYGLAGLVTVVGLFYYVSAEVRGFEMRRRIANIQRQQQVNLDEIQRRLQEQSKQQGGAPAVPAATPPKR